MTKANDLNPLGHAGKPSEHSLLAMELNPVWRQDAALPDHGESAALLNRQSVTGQQIDDVRQALSGNADPHGLDSFPCAWMLEDSAVLAEVDALVRRELQCESRMAQVGLNPMHVDRLTVISGLGLVDSHRPRSSVSYAIFAARLGYSSSRYRAQMDRDRHLRVRRQVVHAGGK
jgi:hypothetical protein